VNLYAINAHWAPHDELTFVLAKSDEAALEHGVFVAVKDLIDGYDSPPQRSTSSLKTSSWPTPHMRRMRQPGGSGRIQQWRMRSTARHAMTLNLG